MSTLTLPSLLEQYTQVRRRSEQLCKPLHTEDYVVQPTVDVSPPKWHLAHTTWFFEQFVLSAFPGYKPFHDDFAFMFNSYYESVGKRVLRPSRGNMSRPTVDEVYQYRRYVDDAMEQALMDEGFAADMETVLTLGFHHEQQHQELLLTDVKYILGHNPLFPAYGKYDEDGVGGNDGWADVEGGLHTIGHQGDGFCFDNELGAHKVHLDDFSLSKHLVTNDEYLAFILDGGYSQFKFWHAEGWDWVNQHQVKAPLYWHQVDGHWHVYTLDGFQPLSLTRPLTHISFYEASAFANWKGMRLPTEFEWEAAQSQFEWGSRWEWTNSAYLAYPGFRRAAGALGEYNGKFMVNQMVLRGASVATPPGHARHTYRNFFHPHLRWQYTGIRLAK